MKRLVVMMVGVMVEADSPEEARRRATIPLQFGALPGVVKTFIVGERPSRPEDFLPGAFDIKESLSV